ncbi:unnamed protein product [Pneumocystis jirovecii]|uniref:Uncharacterized protein n=1 Tax=Pneumocystis jirovecii TaxID=42068 RepID=L0PDJ8_PNEJI|nr:unnamed protein product [Pneumocystis jirovecii]
MKLPIFSIFLSITCVLSRADESKNNHISNRKFLNDDEAFARFSQGDSPDFNKKIKKDLLEMKSKFNEIISTLQNQQQNNLDDSLKPLAEYLSGRNLEDDLVLSMLSYFKGHSTIQECKIFQKIYSSALNNFDKDNKDDAMDKLHSLLSNDDLCKKLLKHLESICLNIKNEHDSIKEYTQDICNLHLVKCQDLKESCGEPLKESCKKLEEKCRKTEHTTEDKTHVHPKDLFVKVHTVLTTHTIVAMETVIAPDIYVETLIITKTCCLGRPAPTHTEPEPEPEPEPEDPEEGEPDEQPGEEEPEEEPGKEESDKKPEEEPEEEPEEVPEEEEPGKEEPEEEEKPEEVPGEEKPEEEPEEEKPEEEPEEEKPEDQEPEPEPVPEEPDQEESGDSDDKDCTITKTTTVTPEGTEKPGIDDKGYGVRVQGFERAGIICLIIGITSGVWIFV